MMNYNKPALNKFVSKEINVEFVDLFTFNVVCKAHVLIVDLHRLLLTTQQ